MPDPRDALQQVFREQERFAAGYSPLYADLFGVVAGWLAGGEPAEVAWLLSLAEVRRPFDLTLLLPAALHRDVLAGVPQAAPLAACYPTAGGRVPEAAVLAGALRQVVLARREALTAFIGQAHVQTNETGRGLAWLLPVSALGWPAVHLVELGASAGLNLVAERRGYRLVATAAPERELLRLGAATPQFTVSVAESPGLSHLAGLSGHPSPDVLSRTGGDLHPFPLRSADDELILAAFVWADQPQRLARLREGIDALHAVEGTAAPVRLRPLRLPDELPAFLAALPAVNDAPVVIYNTTVTMYLPDQGAGLWPAIDAWARRQTVPILWLQWEPSYGAGQQPPQTGWLAWSAVLWQDGVSRQHHLGWVHPHGAAASGLDLSPLTTGM
jgi:hypothetical protein